MSVTKQTKRTFTALRDDWVGHGLLASGFKRKGNRWLRACEDDRLTNVVELYSRHYSDANEIRFTVEWAIHLAEYPAIAWRGNERVQSAETSPFSVRIGSLAEDKMDLWWGVSQDSVVRRTSRGIRRVRTDDHELRDLIGEKLLPIANQKWTGASLLEFLEATDQDNPFVHYNIPLYSRAPVPKLVRTILERST